MAPMHTIAVLFAQPPTWTDKEVIGTVVSVVVALITLFGIALKIATGLSRRRARMAEMERQKLQSKLDSLTASVATSDLQDVEQQLERARREADQHLKTRLLSDFLAASFGAEYPNLLDFTCPILPEQKSALVPTTDNLAYAETNLTIRWLLREGNRDPRFLLRKELQMKRITNQYDIVLMDCPPIINVCCVNALAASDYVLIPILPSKQATSRVPVLLRRLKEFREKINPELKIMGILANRTHWSELTSDEKNRLSGLRVECRDEWGTEIALFDTTIRQSTAIRAAEDEHRPLLPQNETYHLFEELAKEVDSRFPTFCKAAAPDRTAKGVVS